MALLHADDSCRQKHQQLDPARTIVILLVRDPPQPHAIPAFDGVEEGESQSRKTSLGGTFSPDAALPGQHVDQHAQAGFRATTIHCETVEQLPPAARSHQQGRGTWISC